MLGGTRSLLKSISALRLSDSSSRCLSTTSSLSWHKMSWRGHGYGHHGGPWLCLYNPNDGRRESYPLAHERFKRLDWGMYIRPRAGRAKKHWKKPAENLWKLEQHIFCAPFHVRRLERMFAPEMKEPRFIPNDPYLKYNRLSYYKHYFTKHKNRENIRRFGNPIYKYVEKGCAGADAGLKLADPFQVQPVEGAPVQARDKVQHVGESAVRTTW